MRQWIRQILDKYFTRVVYSPEVRQLGPIKDPNWAGLLAELAKGYDNHAPVFHAVQIMLRRAEGEMMKVPRFKTPAELANWQAEQYGLVCEVDVLRRVLRLPIEGQKLKVKYAKQAEKKREEEEEESDLD